MNEFLSLTVFGTFSGMTATVTLLTQVLKQYVKIDPKWLALLVSGIMILFVEIVLPGLITYESVFLAAANWLLVAGTSVGLFEGAKSLGRAMGEKT